MTFQVHLLQDLREAMSNLAQRGNWAKRGFNMGIWARGKLPETPLLDCGTTCCAYGVGTTLPSWQEAGLGWKDNPNWIPQYTPSDGGPDILGITVQQWYRIFSPFSYTNKFEQINEITPLQVVEHIDEVIAEAQAYSPA